MQTKTFRWSLAVGLLALLAVVLSVWAGATAVSSAPASQPDLPTIDIPAGAPIVLMDEPPGARNPGLDAAMQAMAAAAGPDAVTAVAGEQGLRLDNGRVQTLVLTDDVRVKTAVAEITAVGGTVTGTAGDNHYVQAWLPVAELDQLARRPAIDAIQRPAEPLLAETELAVQATTEGLGVINAPAWHAAGINGQGVKVAVIDGGFLGYPGLLGSDLPANVTVRNFVDGESDAAVNGTTRHGTACAEIVHDIAPGAQLYLIKIGTNVDLQEAVNYAIGQGVDVITTSLAWYNLTPGDGTGFFNNLVSQARSAGIIWTTAAGNDRLLHWGGAFNDTDADGFHNFPGVNGPINFFGPGNNQAWSIPAGTPVRAFLRWDDWGNPTQDYNLLLFRWSGSNWVQVAASGAPQNGGSGQTPTEFATYTASGASTAYGFAIQRVNSSRNVNLEVLTPKVAPSLHASVPARSLANLADAASAVTVAALDVESPYPQESYSAEGPANGPGGTATGGIMKPDLAAFANVSTESYGAGGFNGTSSATPHVAGAMALVLDAYPGYAPQQVQDFLAGRAIDMGPGGKDPVYGHGRLFLGAPAVINVTDRGYLPALFAPQPTPTTAPTATPTTEPTGSLQVDNQTGGTVRLTLVGFGTRDFTPGITLWSSIPPARYDVVLEALSGPCQGATGGGTLDIIAGEVAGITLTCGANALGIGLE